VKRKKDIPAGQEKTGPPLTQKKRSIGVKRGGGPGVESIPWVGYRLAGDPRDNGVKPQPAYEFESVDETYAAWWNTKVGGKREGANQRTTTSTQTQDGQRITGTDHWGGGGCPREKKKKKKTGKNKMGSSRQKKAFLAKAQGKKESCGKKGKPVGGRVPRQS